MDKTVWSLRPQGKGSKKTATAYVRLESGEGRFIVNGEPAASYFSENRQWRRALDPFDAVDIDRAEFDIRARVEGRAKRWSKRQPRALAHAIAGALVAHYPSLRTELWQAGYRFEVLSPPDWTVELSDGTRIDLSRDPDEIWAKHYALFEGPVPEELSGNPHVLTFGRRWLLDALLITLEDDDLLKVQQYLDEQGEAVSDFEILTELFEVTPGDDNFDRWRFSLSYQLQQKRRRFDVEFVGSGDAWAWAREGDPIEKPERHRRLPGTETLPTRYVEVDHVADDLAEDEELLEETEEEQPAAWKPTRQTWEYVLTYYDWAHGHLPYRREARELIPPLREGQRRAMLQFLAEQVDDEPFTVELRTHAGKTWLQGSGLQDFFVGHLRVPGARIWVDRTEKASLYKIRYRPVESVKRILLFFEQERLRPVRREVEIACDVDEDMLLAESRYQDVQALEKLDRVDRRSATKVLAQVFELVGEHDESQDVYYARFEDVFHLLCVIKPYARSTVETILYGRQHPWFCSVEGEPGRFVYDPNAFRTAEVDSKSAPQTAEGDAEAETEGVWSEVVKLKGRDQPARQPETASPVSETPAYFIFQQHAAEDSEYADRIGQVYNWRQGIPGSQQIKEGARFIYYRPGERVFLGSGRVDCIEEYEGEDGETYYDGHIADYEPWEPPLPLTRELAEDISFIEPDWLSIGQAGIRKVSQADFEAIVNAYRELQAQADETDPLPPAEVAEEETQPAQPETSPPQLGERGPEQERLIDVPTPLEAWARTEQEDDTARSERFSASPAGTPDQPPPSPPPTGGGGEPPSPPPTEPSRPAPSPTPRTSKSLFSQHYLENRIQEHEEWNEDVSGPFERLRALYEEKHDILPRLNEAQTEEEFIRPALGMLGFAYVPQTAVRQAGRVQRPDYALFPDPRTKDEAYGYVHEEPAFYGRALAIADAKYWERPLSETSRDDPRDAFKNTNPSFQIVNYLVGTEVDWGILTNGRHWRLYYRQASSTATEFYEVDLVELLEGGDLDAFKYFWLFFRRDAFIEDAQGNNFLERVREGSATYARVIGDKLKGLVFDEVFPLLAGGFVAHATRHGQDLTSQDARRQVYEATLSVLYKALFLLYAEARGLLPMDNAGYRDVSLTHMMREIARRIDQKLPLGERSTGYYNKLLNLCQLVDGGDAGLGLPRYNGGLFHFDFSDPRDREKYAANWFLTQHKIPDKFLAEALEQLWRIEGEPIDYGFIGVRHLGAMYEGLLEHRLRVDDAAQGEVHLETDKGERKATGSYYTPDYIVKYIVQQTVGPILEERRQQFDALMDEIVPRRSRLAEVEANLGANPQRADNVASRWKNEATGLRRELKQLERQARETLLDIKVCDPAMGSGHFLVEAVDVLTDGFIEILNEYPEYNPVLSWLERIRQQIVGNLSGQGIQVDPARLNDTQLLQRVVMKRCIYGVDLNPMAVELAKVSLWLHSFTIGAPLSFLDHHLRHGNSLIGAMAREAEEEMSGSSPEGQMSFLRGPFAGLLRAAEIMRGITTLSDATLAEVEESERLFREFDQAAEPYKRLLDVYVSRHFGVKQAREFLDIHLPHTMTGEKRIEDVLDAVERPYDAVLAEARRLFEEKGFFHWDLEFPEVFIDLDRADWAPNPGFDLVVGNPPYVFIISVPQTERNYYYEVFSTCDYRFDVYGLFVERGLDVLKQGGQFGYIIPHSVLNNNSFEKLRSEIVERSSYVRIIDFTDSVFTDASNEPMLLLVRLRKQDRSEQPLLESTLIPSQELSLATERMKQYSASLIEHLPGKPFIVRGGEWLEKTIRNPLTIPLGESIRATQGLRTGDNARFITTEPTTKLHRKVLAGGDIFRYGYDWSGAFVLYDRSKLDAPRDDAFWQASEKILVQEVRNVHLPQRIVACLDTDRFIGLNTTNAIILKSGTEISLHYVMAVLSSKLINEFFRSCFVDNHIATQYLESIPVRKIAFTTPISDREQLTEQAQQLYARYLSTTDQDLILSFVEQQLAHQPECADVVHNVLAFLAEQMIDLRKEQQATVERFWLNLDGTIGDAGTFDKLRNKGKWESSLWKAEACRPFVDKESRSTRTLDESLGWNEAAFKAFVKMLAGSVSNLSEIVAVYRRHAPEYQRLSTHIRRTDDLIDQIVYRLYGLTGEEIAIVEDRAA